jgi:hypothetical protein
MTRNVTLEVSATLRLSTDLKSKLLKIGAAETLKDGKDRSMHDIVEMIVKFYEENKDKEKSKK